MAKPLIVVTNDDGIDAPGIKNLVQVAAQFGELLVVAPSSAQSGMGHAVTVNVPLTFKESEMHAEHLAYACSGTPVDCVKVAKHILGNRKADLLVSGINHGENSATNVLYSGTMGAAIEGAIANIPSVGFSLMDFSFDADFKAAKSVAAKIIDQILQQGLPNGVCLNVNVPKVDPEGLKGIKICRQAKAVWDDKLEKRQNPFGREYHWLTGQFESADTGTDSDLWALHNGYASVVPQKFDLTDYNFLDSLCNWEI